MDCENQCPELLPENYEAWYLYTNVQTQYNYTFGGIIGLNYQSMCTVADILGVEISPSLFAKIRALEHEHLKEAVNKNG